MVLVCVRPPADSATVTVIAQLLVKYCKVEAITLVQIVLPFWSKIRRALGEYWNHVLVRYSIRHPPLG